MKQRYRIEWDRDYMFLNLPIIGYRIVPINDEAKVYCAPHCYKYFKS